MSVLSDSLIAANIVLDLIEAFKKQGIDITVENLEEAIAQREAEIKDLHDKLGIE